MTFSMKDTFFMGCIAVCQLQLCKVPSGTRTKNFKAWLTRAGVNFASVKIRRGRATNTDQGYSWVWFNMQEDKVAVQSQRVTTAKGKDRKDLEWREPRARYTKRTNG
jgi:hypothetical protein